MLIQQCKDYRVGRWKDMGLLLQHVKTYIFRNGHENTSHNIMQDCPLPTMCAMKKVDPHKIQRLVTNVP